jgi:hypothetical protein
MCNSVLRRIVKKRKNIVVLFRSRCGRARTRQNNNTEVIGMRVNKLKWKKRATTNCEGTENQQNYEETFENWQCYRLGEATDFFCV